jgi:Xaa-Pro aminopeptidase
VAEDEHLARSTTADAVTQLRLCRRDEEPTGAAFVTHAIDEMGWSGRRIGLEWWSHRPSPGFADRLQRAFEAAGYAVTDATGVVRETRVERVEPGMTELELRGEIDAAMAREGGEPDPAAASRAEKVARAVDRVADRIEPGLPVSALVDVARTHFQDEGIWQHREWIGGYELGIAFPPDWVGAFRFEPGHDSDRTLEPGTVVNFESQVHLPREAGRFAAIDTILVTDDDAELLSERPPDLVVV